MGDGGLGYKSVSLGFKKHWCGSEEDRRRNRMRL